MRLTDLLIWKIDKMDILTYHKVGIRFDSSVCWRDHYRFLQDIVFFQSSGYELDTISSEHTWEKKLAITFDDGFEGIFRYRDFFKERKIKTTIFLISDYIGKLDNWEISLFGLKFKHLDISQIKKLAKDGHEIGSHTSSHKSLVGLSKDSLKKELYDSKMIIEEILEKEITSISVPFGRIDEKVYETCLKYGYENIVSIGKTSFTQDNLLRSKSVYLGDNNFVLNAKLGNNSFSKVEERRLDIINWFSGGTIVVKQMANGK